jgi:hypothetical protein
VVDVEKKKTSVYLSEEDRERLARLAERKGESQAWVIREALLAYDASQPDKNYAILDMRVDPGYPGIPDIEDPDEFQDWLDTVAMKGFGADSLGEPLAS